MSIAIIIPDANSPTGMITSRSWHETEWFELLMCLCNTSEDLSRSAESHDLGRFAGHPRVYPAPVMTEIGKAMYAMANSETPIPYDRDKLRQTAGFALLAARLLDEIEAN